MANKKRKNKSKNSRKASRRNHTPDSSLGEKSTYNLTVTSSPGQKRRFIPKSLTKIQNNLKFLIRDIRTYKKGIYIMLVCISIMYMMFFGWSIHIAGVLALLPILGGIEANINAKSRRWKRRNRAKIMYRKPQSALGKWIVGLVSKKKVVREGKGDEAQVKVGMEKNTVDKVTDTKVVEEKVETRVEKLLPFV